jgi:Uri superfamily endonuclease
VIAHELPRAPGTYVLMIQVTRPIVISPGRLGTFRLDEGWYAYVGSARGSGGLAARVARHLRAPRERRPRWHIDYLTALAPVIYVIWATGNAKRECQWARRLLALPGSAIPIPRFGASDCHCPTHLIRLKEGMIVSILMQALRAQEMGLTISVIRTTTSPRRT